MKREHLYFISLLLVLLIVAGCGSNNSELSGTSELPFAQGTPQTTPIQPNTPIPNETISHTDNENSSNTLSQTPLRIACVGDSLTEGYGYPMLKMRATLYNSLCS